MKHIIENLGDGKILVKDITPLAEYDSLGVTLPGDVTSVSFRLSKYNSDDILSFPISTSNIAYLRDNSGYVIETGEVFEDYVYESKLSFVTTTAGTLESNQNSLFIKNLTRRIININKNTSWKEYFGYYSTNIKTPLRRMSWLYDVKFSFEAGLYAESVRILKALEKIC